MTPHAYLLPNTVTLLREAVPGVLIVIGGAYVYAYREQALTKSGADLAVVGEGEIPMETIISAFGSKDMDSVPGLLRRLSDGSVVTNPGISQTIEDLNSIPFPAYDLINLAMYWRLPQQNVLPYPRKYISLVTSRGCPYKCAYCHNIFGRTFRHYSAERIVEEISYFKYKFGVDEICFWDDCFNFNRKRLFDFSKALLAKEGRMKIVFPNGLRTDLLDEAAIEALVNAGMYASGFALESGSPRIQKLIDKHLCIDKFLRAVQLAQKAGVFCNGFAMMGFPTETEADMKTTTKVATLSSLHTIEFFTVTPFPNTPLYDYTQKHIPERLATLSYDDQEYWRMASNLSAESDATLHKCQRKAMQVFYSRPIRIYHILRDYPKPAYLPSRIPLLLRRMMRGSF